jgi:hypothetical protein
MTQLIGQISSYSRRSSEGAVGAPGNSRLIAISGSK